MSKRSLPRRIAVATAAGLLTFSSSLFGVAPPAGAAPSLAAQVDPAPPAPAPPAPVTLHYLPLSGPELREGSTGSEVFLMQITLVSRGFWLSDFPGYFGSSTRHALVAFQKYSGFQRSGRLDPITRYVLGATLDRAVPRVPKAGPSVEVDISRQIMTVSNWGITNWVFDVSTGKSSTPTPRGSYRITRQINGLRISNLGELWRPKYFVGGYALHGSPSVPAYPASHGCVRMTNQEIDFLWSSGFAPVGTPVTLF